VRVLGKGGEGLSPLLGLDLLLCSEPYLLKTGANLAQPFPLLLPTPRLTTVANEIELFEYSD